MYYFTLGPRSGCDPPLNVAWEPRISMYKQQGAVWPIERKESRDKDGNVIAGPDGRPPPDRVADCQPEDGAVKREVASDVAGEAARQAVSPKRMTIALRKTWPDNLKEIYEYNKTTARR